MGYLKYTYALDSTKMHLVHINNAQKGNVYYCPYSECNERLIIKDGGNRKKHFSHINNGEKCSYDNYLHSLAERRIVEWFNSSKEITINLKSDIYCVNYDNCIWKNNNQDSSISCHWQELCSYNLKTYYNCIETEKGEHGFIWDLWLTNTIKNHDPIAIEIYVTHKCEDDKLKSKTKVIEIKIENEWQLDKLINSNELVQGENISFYNFKPKPKYKQCTENLKLNKFILDESKRAKFKLLDCNSIIKREYKSIYELTLNNKIFNAFYLACAKASTIFPDFKHCSLCQYYKYNDLHCQHICILYKYLNLKDNHNGANATTCHKYSINQEFINESIEYLSQLSLDEWIKEQ